MSFTPDFPPPHRWREPVTSMAGTCATARCTPPVVCGTPLSISHPATGEDELVEAEVQLMEAEVLCIGRRVPSTGGSSGGHPAGGARLRRKTKSYLSCRREAPEDGIVPDLLFPKVPQGKVVKNRLHLCKATPHGTIWRHTCAAAMPAPAGARFAETTMLAGAVRRRSRAPCPADGKKAAEEQDGERAHPCTLDALPGGVTASSTGGRGAWR